MLVAVDLVAAVLAGVFGAAVPGVAGFGAGAVAVGAPSFALAWFEVVTA